MSGEMRHRCRRIGWKNWGQSRFSVGLALLWRPQPMVVGSDILARLGRYFLPDQPLHVIQRGNNRQAIFFSAEDYARYRDCLAEAAARAGCAIHAYVLMTNHVHLL